MCYDFTKRGEEIMARKLCFNVFAALAGLIGSAIGSWIGQLLFINVLGKK